MKFKLVQDKKMNKKIIKFHNKQKKKKKNAKNIIH